MKSSTFDLGLRNVSSLHFQNEKTDLKERMYGKLESSKVTGDANKLSNQLRYTTFIVVWGFLISKFPPESKIKSRGKFVIAEHWRWHSLCSDFRSIASDYS